MSRNRRLQSTFVLFVLLASIFASAFPAYAVVAGSTASLDLVNNPTGEVMSGESQTFAFTVTNTGAAASQTDEVLGEASDASINWVRIRTEVFGQFVPTNAGSSGWTPHLVDLDRDGFVDTVDFTGGEIGPGDPMPFTVDASAARVAADRVATWSVRVSDDGGDTSKSATGTNLTTPIRVLRVDAVEVSAPVGATDGTATASQPNLQVQTRVRNFGTQALTVDPSLASNTSGDTVTDQGAAAIASGASQTFTFPVALGSSTASRTFSGAGSATGAAAKAVDSSSLTVQAPAAFTYTDNTLQPRAAVSGAVKTFTLNVGKTNPPAVNYDLANTVLTFTKTPGGQQFSTTLASPASTGNGSVSELLTFNAITIPGSAALRNFDGAYSPSLTIVGTDDNNAPVSRTVGIGNNFEIDNLVPFVEPAIAAPGNQVNHLNVPTAKDGQTLTFSGPIKTGAAPTDPADTTATVSSCFLVITDLSGVELSRTPVTCSNNAGQLSGSATLATAGLEAGRALVEVVVADLAGNATVPTQSTGYVLIDNTIPRLAGALTGCAAGAVMTCDDYKTIRVNLSEPTIGDLMPVDFTVDGDVVIDATETSCTKPTATSANYCRQVILTLLQGWGSETSPDDHEGTVDYMFRALPTRTNPSDGAKNNLPTTAVVNALDGIVPDLPSLASVSQDGMDASGQPTSNFVGPQGGAFFTNQETPTFRIADVADGYVGIVALDDNGIANYQDEPTVNGGTTTPADTLLASCLAESSSVDCTPTSALSSDADYALLISSRDREGNLSEGKTAPLVGLHARPITLTLDNVAPQASGFTPGGVSDLTTTFSEILGAGRNSAADWIAVANLPSGEKEGFDVGAVTGSGDSRTVTVDDTDYTAGAADALLYTLVGSPDKRYQDQAGNYLGDFTLLAP